MDGRPLRGVGKSYGLGEELSLQHTLSTLVRREYQRERLWALTDVSFEVRRGEFFGIVGANGSGKSTLTQLISGIAMQDTGTIEVRGASYRCSRSAPASTRS